jgi:hypothetical protein
MNILGAYNRMSKAMIKQWQQDDKKRTVVRKSTTDVNNTWNKVVTKLQNVV